LRDKVQFYEKLCLRLTKPQVKPASEGKAGVTIGIERYVVFDLPVAQKEPGVKGQLCPILEIE